MWILFALNIVLLIFCVVRKKKYLWGLLGVYELACFVCSALQSQYYDSLPGTGKAPGLAYFAETMGWLAATAAFFGMFLISLVVFLVVITRKENANE